MYYAFLFWLRFAYWGIILAAFGVIPEPQKCEFGQLFPRKGMHAKGVTRMLHLTCGLFLGQKGRTKSQKFDKRPLRGRATAQPTLKSSVQIAYNSKCSHPAKFGFYMVGAYFVQHGVEIPVFLYLCRPTIHTTYSTSMHRCDL
jgi:hypothetical protein